MGHPTYMHGDRNIALFGAFRSDFRLTFFNAALLKDPDGILEKRGPNKQHPDIIRFVGNHQVKEKSAIIRAYLREAMAYAEAGIKPVRQEMALVLTEELIDALDADPNLAHAFHTLTPGRQKSYVINLNGAKKVATRIARIEKFRPKILAGKGAFER